jgi:hypothetical protein
MFEFFEVFVLNLRIIIHPNTSLYIAVNLVILGLGKFTPVYARDMLYTISQSDPIYMPRHPNPPRSYEA